MNRFNDSEDNNGMSRFIKNYGDNVKTHQQQHDQQQQSQQQQQQKQQSQQQQKSQDIYGVPLQQFYNNGTQLNKDQQQQYKKFSSMPIYGMEQRPPYYSQYYENSSYRLTSPLIMAGSPFTYDPSQPPPPLPTMNNTEPPAPPPPLPPGDPPYYSTSSINMKTPLSINSTPPPIHPDGGQSSYCIDLACGISNNNSQRRTLSRGSFRGARSERAGVKRNPFTFKKTSNKTHFKTTPVTQLNGQKKNISNKTPTNAKSSADGEEDADDTLSHIQVNKKAKRKPMSTRYPRKIEWDRGDALKALALEKEYNKLQRNSMLILKFPDPELNKNIVKEYSPYIESVHFQQPSTPRYCFVQLKEGVDIETVREKLCEIPFGVGKIVAERKRMHSEEDDTVNPEDIDPYTLYIGNLPTTITVKTVKEHFPNSRRIDIGYAQRMRYTRYAFIRYETVEDAMEAYRNTFNLLIESRSLIVRFRRQKGNVGLPGESRPSNPKKEAANDQNKKQSDSLTNKDGAGSQDGEDADVYYVSGEPGTIFRAPDPTQTALEQFNLARMQNERDFSQIDVEIKKELIEEGQRNQEWSSIRIKDEPMDDDELMTQSIDCYDDEYSDDEDEDCDGNHDCDDHNASCRRSDSTQNWDDYRRKELNSKEEKFNPAQSDAKGLPVPFPIYSDNLNSYIRPNSSFVGRGLMLENSSLAENKKPPAPKKVRDELDDLFDRMNDDDDLTF